MRFSTSVSARFATSLVIARLCRDRLCDNVEVDESLLTDPKPSVPNRGTLGKLLFEEEVELDKGRPRRAQLSVISNTSTVNLDAFLTTNMGPGSCASSQTNGRPIQMPAGLLHARGHVDYSLRSVGTQSAFDNTPGLLACQTIVDEDNKEFGQP
ncbi:MAG: hypothetical protein ACYDHP_14430 [Ferrimicrobium sp.]